MVTHTFTSYESNTLMTNITRSIEENIL